MSLKALIAGGIALAGAALMTAPAEAKTKIYFGVGYGDPYYDCYNPGLIDYCGRGFYRPYGYYRPAYRYPRFYYDDGHYVGRRDTCRAAARAIRSQGYRNIKALDCKGQQYMFKATKRGKVHRLKVNTVTGRISRVR